MASEEVPQAPLDEKVGDLKLEEPKGEETPEEQKEAVLEELTESPPELHHVETADTTAPVADPPTAEDGVVKSEVPEAFAEELKTDHDIVPPAEDKPTDKPTETAEATPEDVDEKKPSKISAIGDKISAKIHKIAGKD